MSKDVLIAGGIVVACLGLVTLAFLPGKDKPASDPGLSAPIGGGGDLGMGPIGAAPGGQDQYGPQPSPVGGDGFGPNPGGGFNPGPAPTPSPMPSPAPLPPSPGPVVGGDAGGFGNDPFAPLPPVGGGPVAPAPGPGAGPDLGGGFPSPTPAPVAQAEPSPAPATGEQSHVVGKGETLGDISTRYYGSSKHWKKIQAANPGLKPENMKVGETIAIPALEADGGTGGGTAGAPGTYTLKPGDSYYTIAKRQLGSAARWRELEQLNGIPAEELRAGQTIKLPVKDGAPEQAAAASGGKVHVVRKGETLGDISKDFYGTTTKWRKIVDANPGLAPERLKVGQRIVIPPAPAAVPGTVTEDGKYVVKAGDNLGTIAQQQLGTAKAWKKILEANPGIDPKGLRVGQQLRIPGGAKHAGAAQDATAPADGGQPGEPGVPGGPAPVPGVPPPPPAPTYRDDPFFDPYLTVPAPAQAAPGVPAGPTTPSPGFPGEGLR